MPCELLIHVNETLKSLRGSIQDVRDSASLAVHPWGGMESLPDFVKLYIDDATADQVTNYIENVRNVIDYELVASNANGRRYRLYVHPNLVTLFSVDTGLRVEIRDYIVDNYNAVLVSHNNGTEAVFDIPNTDWQALRDDVLDLFETQLATRRWYFSDSAITSSVLAGGYTTATKAQVLSTIIDRLA